MNNTQEEVHVQQVCNYIFARGYISRYSVTLATHISVTVYQIFTYTNVFQHRFYARIDHPNDM